MTLRRMLGVVLATLTLVGCGKDDDAESAGASGNAGTPALTVSAATSLKQAFSEYGGRLAGATVRFSFAGSDVLAAQIEQGVKPDVFAAANTKLPARLYAKGLVEKPSLFAANRLVLAVPARTARVASLEDLGDDGVTLAIGSEKVPVGSYTRTVLARLEPAQRERILANVRSEEPDVAGIAGKLTNGAVDAGFLYISDVRAANGRLRAIELDGRLQPSVAYAAAVVKGAKRPKQARAFIAGLRSGAGAGALERAGFEPPPTR